MIKHALIAVATIAGTVTLAAPVYAQAGGRALIIYGNDPCPANTICVRAKEEDRYRIPESLRSGPLEGADQTWRQKSGSVLSAGDSGTGSCTPVGAGGSTGCLQKQLRAARAENKQKRDAEAASPLPR